MTQHDLPPPRRGRFMARFFWGTIFAFAAATIALAVVGYWRGMGPQVTADGTGAAPPVVAPPQPAEIPATTLEKLIAEAAQTAYAATAADLDGVLTTLYAPVYAAIPAYADFHYSVLGEYTELASAALGRMGEGLNEHLFGGFLARFESAAAQLDATYLNTYKAALEAGIARELPADVLKLPLGPLTQTAVQDALDRAKITVPLAAATAVAGTAALKAATAVIAQKMAIKITAKTATKGAAKTLGPLAAGLGGAALCGPLAPLCGVAAAGLAWIATDMMVIRLDEYFSRDEFEAELRRLVDEDKAQKRSFLEAALKEKSRKLEAAAKDFTLRDLATPPPAGADPKPQGPAPMDGAPQETAPQDAAPKDAAPQGTAPKAPGP